MQLSKHFTLKEMTKSMTATRKGIDNTPGSGEIKSLGDLCYEVLEPLRAHFDKAVTITSGYRSEALCDILRLKLSGYVDSLNLHIMNDGSGNFIGCMCN